MRRIALIDDEESICQSLSALLGRDGFEVLRFLSPRAFLNDPSAWAGVDAVVSDVNMAELDGIELGLKIRKAGYLGPIIFITGMGGFGIEQYGRALAPFRLVRKPFRSKQLSDVIVASVDSASRAVAPGAAALTAAETR